LEEPRFEETQPSRSQLTLRWMRDQEALIEHQVRRIRAQSVQFNNMVEWAALISRWYSLHIGRVAMKDRAEVEPPTGPPINLAARDIPAESEKKPEAELPTAKLEKNLDTLDLEPQLQA
jgi:hypothetical protein